MLMYRLRFCFAVIFLIHLDDSVSADWVALEDRYQVHPLQIAYIDLSTIRRDGNVVTLSALIDWKAMQGGRTPTRFYSTKLTRQFDCVEKRFRTLSSTDFYGHMGTGEVIGGSGHFNEGPWVVIEAGTMNEGLWEAACK